MKNNKVKGILIAVLALTIAVGATLAYLMSNTNTETNKFTFAGVDGKDIEGTITEDWKEEDGKGVMPGDEIEKAVYFTNTSSDELSEENAKVWGAIKVIFELEQATGDPIPATAADMVLINQIMELDINTLDWEAVTDTSDNNIIYIHKNTLDRGQKSNPLFTTVTISPDVDNDLLAELEAIAPKGVNIKVTGAVLQAKGIEYNYAVGLLVDELSK